MSPSNLAIVSNILGSGGLTISGNSTYSGVTATGGSTITLSTDNTYTGVTSLDDGILDLGTAYSLGTSTLQFTDGLLADQRRDERRQPDQPEQQLRDVRRRQRDDVHRTDDPVQLAASRQLPVDHQHRRRPSPTGGFPGVTFAGVISGPGGLTIEGSTGTTNTFLTITRANTFTGGIVFAGLAQASSGQPRTPRPPA